MPNNITPSAGETPLPRIHKPLPHPLNCARNPHAQGKPKAVDRSTDDIVAVKKMTAWSLRCHKVEEQSHAW